jgi:site-specific recombinase XerD
VLDELVGRYARACEAQGLAATTIANRAFYLRHFTTWLSQRAITEAAAVTRREIEAYGEQLRAYRYRWEKAAAAPWRKLEARTIRARLLILGQFFRWLVQERSILADPAAGLVSKALPRELPVRSPTESEMNRILAAADTRTNVGCRNRALLELLYSTGLRVAEAEAIDLTDLDLTSGTLLVRCGKGGRSRVVPIGDTAVAALLDYIRDIRPRCNRRPGVAALFLAATHCGTTGQRLSTASIRDIVRYTARAAGIDRRINPHQIRHACATHMLRAGADLRHIQQILGHARIDTTEIYTHVDTTDLADVLARTHPRFHSKQRSR